jgi:hypothetical protein
VGVRFPADQNFYHFDLILLEVLILKPVGFSVDVLSSDRQTHRVVFMSGRVPTRATLVRLGVHSCEKLHVHCCDGLNDPRKKGTAGDCK